MFRQYARTPRGQRGNIRINGKLHTRIGLVVGQFKGKLLTPFTYGGTMKAPPFEQWFKDELLNALPKGRVIIMDNASFHKKEILYGITKKHKD